jgi:hypothetical protein
VFASWTDVGIGSSVVIELVRQKAVADAGPSEALPDPPVIFYPRADEFDILIVRRENVLAARIASIHNDLLRHIRVASKHEPAERILAAIEDINQQLVVHT